MALETLKGIEKIDGYGVAHHYVGDWYTTVEVGQYVIIDHRDNCISFEMQDGPIKEVGINGVQVDTLIWTAKIMLLGLNDKFPCEENEDAIHFLGKALQRLSDRKKDREKRGVEGKSEA